MKIFFYVCFIKINIISLSLELKWLTFWGNSSSGIFRLYFKLERVVQNQNVTKNSAVVCDGYVKYVEAEVDRL